ncbi:unnamed protein product [Ilex paraguariensis]|uniref:Uncharacterized protein n=1 Tax=Ilex paraguariensis TaxID=185542 RepID=A0ABC8SUE8_9AQUA
MTLPSLLEVFSRAQRATLGIDHGVSLIAQLLKFLVAIVTVIEVDVVVKEVVQEVIRVVMGP